ncbi:RNA polymerase sigma factor [Crateriforma spongiae]|uniref:RNA polymerase sigma factor n=1 Tax=Crateriforma spongiae TaxID=2724528 RepID=UPI0021BC916E|nr:sigma-70 family RNA polymerase sigma factor [Crateriforma spongiae]
MDAEQICRIWDTHRDRLMLIARAMDPLVSDGGADDAVQEAFIELAKRGQPPDDPVAWMARIIRNRLLMWRRGRQRRRERENDYARLTWLVRRDDSAAIDIDPRKLTEVLQTMPDDQRQVIVMRWWGDMTFRQIAGVLGQSRSRTHRQYQHGIAHLRTLLAPETQREPSRCIR